MPKAQEIAAIVAALVIAVAAWIYGATVSASLAAALIPWAAIGGAAVLALRPGGAVRRIGAWWARRCGTRFRAASRIVVALACCAALGAAGHALLRLTLCGDGHRVYTAADDARLAPIYAEIRERVDGAAGAETSGDHGSAVSSAADHIGRVRRERASIETACRAPERSAAALSWSQRSPRELCAAAAWGQIRDVASWTALPEDVVARDPAEAERAASRGWLAADWLVLRARLSGSRRADG